MAGAHEINVTCQQCPMDDRLTCKLYQPASAKVGDKLCQKLIKTALAASNKQTRENADIRNIFQWKILKVSLEPEGQEKCSLCNNSRDLLMCDGCEKSFCPTCVPMAEDTPTEDDWFCHECDAFQAKIRREVELLALSMHDFQMHHPWDMPL